MVRGFLAALAAVCAFLSIAAHAERINFDSAARNSNALQIFQGRTAYTDHIYGELRLPSKGQGPFPAMVIMHSSRGIVPTILDWAKMFNDMGIATWWTASRRAVSAKTRQMH